MADVHCEIELLKENVKIEGSKNSNPDLQTGKVNDSGAIFSNDPHHKSEFALKGIVVVAGKEKQLELTTTGLALTDHSMEKKKLENKDLILAWQDVIHTAPDPNGTDEQQHKSFILHYVHHGSKNLLQHHSIKIEVKNEHSETWINAIHTECGKVLERPKKVFVVINPIGGSGSGRQIYHKIVAPLFELAEIHTTVIVTEKAKHALEMGENQDFSSYDGIVVVGGDGMCQEIVQGLFIQLQKKAGIDYHNKDGVFVKPDIPIGIIPAGTGNGLTTTSNGISNAETAALNIIRGESKRTSLLTVYSNGKFVCICTLLFAYGELADMMKRSEELRWMKRARYFYTMMGWIFSKKRIFNCEIQYCQVANSKSENDAESGDSGSENAKASEWITYNSNGRHFIGIMAIPSEIHGAGSHCTPSISGRHVELIINTGCSIVALAKELFRLAKRKPSTSSSAHLDRISGVSAFRIKLIRDDSEPGGALSRTEATARELEHILNIDGEVVYIDKLEMDVRIQPLFVPLFGIQNYPEATATVIK